MRGQVAITKVELEESPLSAPEMFTIIAERHGAPRGIYYFARREVDGIVYFRWDTDITCVSYSYLRSLQWDGWETI